MFKAVTSEQMSQYDPETIELYRRRPNDETFTKIMLSSARPSRNGIPIFVDKNNKFVQELEHGNNMILFYGVGLLAASCN